MKKLSVLMAILFLSGFAVAGHNSPGEMNQNQPPEVDQPDQDIPEDAGDRPGNVTEPSLPDQASDTAKKVVGTVFEGLSSGVQGLGDMVSGIFN